MLYVAVIASIVVALVLESKIRAHRRKSQRKALFTFLVDEMGEDESEVETLLAKIGGQTS